MSGGSRQPLQPKILLSMKDVLTSRTASNVPGPPLGMVHAGQHHLTAHLWGQDSTPAPPHPSGDQEMCSSLCLPERKQSLQITVDCFIIGRSEGKMTVVNSHLNRTWAQRIFELQWHRVTSRSKPRQPEFQTKTPWGAEIGKGTALRFYSSPSLPNVISKTMERNTWFSMLILHNNHLLLLITIHVCYWALKTFYMECCLP